MVAKNKKNRNWKSILKRELFYFLQVVSGSMLGVAIFIGLLYLISPLPFTSYVVGIYADKVSDISTDEKIVTEIAQLCNKKQGMEKIRCVNFVIKGLMDYNITDELAGVITTTEFLNNSGDCFNSATAYCSIFKDMGIDCLTVGFKENINGGDHAFNIIRYRETYCVLDQNVMKCW